ncbi:MAG: tRNA (guanosine(37)-N1)-methyltransferase TrmD [Candidatus Krumholzibacteriota bacterium]|nr:tRNA (guanosine(37)-N1)-methyltransferase TrmD [Candidatus Krumholzibacteriota bacterium]
MINVFFITIFPEMFEGVLNTGVFKIASKEGLADYTVVNLRDYAVDKHGSVDDYPYGGGPGMILMVPPIVEAVEDAVSGNDSNDTAVVLLSPYGRVHNQETASRLAGKKKVIFICGRYKGLDERVSELVVTDRISIGNFILSGGELPAMIVADTVIRYIPGVLGDAMSRDTDSFSSLEGEDFIDSAYYTRPPEYRGLQVPEVLLSGNHKRIREWREQSARDRTARYREKFRKKV